MLEEVVVGLVTAALGPHPPEVQVAAAMVDSN
jgi:hypothetical protein